MLFIFSPRILGVRNYLELVTTEGFGRHDARGMDFMVSIGGKSVRIDPSPKVYQTKRYPAEQEREIERQMKLFSKTDVLIVTHFHNDHFGLDPLGHLDAGKELELAICPNSYGKEIANAPNGLIRKQVRERMEIMKDRCRSVLSVDHYAHLKYNGYEFDIKPLRHGCYKGYDLGEVLTVRINDGNDELFFTSDLSGPEYAEACDWISHCDPTFLVLDGPYNNIMSVLGTEKKQAKKAVRELEKSYDNLRKLVVKSEKMEKIMLCHHFMRNCYMPNNDLTAIPEILKEKISGKRLDSDTKDFIFKKYDSIGRIISRILDELDDQGIQCYIPSLLTDGRLKL